MASSHFSASAALDSVVTPAASASASPATGAHIPHAIGISREIESMISSGFDGAMRDMNCSACDRWKASSRRARPASMAILGSVEARSAAQRSVSARSYSQ